ncbi:MAG: hypothetical protein ACOCQS_00520 [Bacillota bacterium]
MLKKISSINSKKQLDCQPCENIEFCFTLILPEGFEFNTMTEQDKTKFIEDNLTIAANTECLNCEEVECELEVSEPEGCPPLNAIQLFVEGCIRFLAAVPGVVSETDPDLETSICSQNIICIEEPTPVCLSCPGDCETLEIVDFENVEAKKIDKNSCGDLIFEVTGEFIFNCDEVNGNNDDNICECQVTGAGNTGGMLNRASLQLQVCTGCNPEQSLVRFEDTTSNNEVFLEKLPPEGEIISVECENETEATIEGIAPEVVIDGEEFESCYFILTVTDTPPPDPDTMQMTIICDNEVVYDGEEFELLGQSINIQDCPIPSD